MLAQVMSPTALPGLSPIADKEIVARFDGGLLSSDGGLLVSREIEQRLGIASCAAGCIANHHRTGKLALRSEMLVADAVDIRAFTASRCAAPAEAPAPLVVRPHGTRVVFSPPARQRLRRLAGLRGRAHTLDRGNAM